MTRLRLAFAALMVASASIAQAGPVLDRVRAHGVIRCGGRPRPGLVSLRSDGQAFGMLLDLCRAIGAGVLGPEGRVEFRPYDSSKAFDAVRQGQDDVFFLEGSDILGSEGLVGRVIPGPPVFFMQTAVMVAEASPARHLADLAGQPICFSQGSNAQRHLEAWFAARHLPFVRMGYQEDAELRDSYNAQVCRAIAGEATALAEDRLDGGVNDLHSRILPEPLAVFPILAATGVDDPAWSSIVTWAIYSLQRAEAPGAAWEAGGLASLPVDASKLGLEKSWQARVVAAAGSYGDIFRRTLGDASPYKLPRGVNAMWRDGGLFAVPHDD